MSLSINYPKHKINIKFSFLPSVRIAVIVLGLQATPRRFSPDQGDRRVVAKPAMVLIILSTINQPFSESSGFVESKRIILKVFLPGVCSISPFFRGQVLPG